MKKRAKTAPRQSAPPPKPSALSLWSRFESLLDRHAIWIAVALVALATARIVSTYTVFSHTFDEPAHIACGMQWLEKHTYTYEAQHPPLTRVMVALLPKVFGVHGTNQKSMWDEGLAILFSRGTEDFTLALARLGTLPFFWITCWIAFSCTRWISSRASTAVIAVFLLTMTPTVLAHAGLATTDMGLTAMFLLAVYTGWRWLEQPVLWRAAAFGASTGLAVLSKFSTLPFLPSVAIVALLFWLFAERPNIAHITSVVIARLPQALLAAAVGAIVIWAGYLFSFGKTADFPFPVPAPELFDGIRQVKHHNATGHETYLLGAQSYTGWWYFYLVALAIKTPLLILALGLIGLVLLCSKSRFGTRGWIAPSIVLGILIFSSFFSRIRIGTRHVLPVFVMFAIAGACAVIWLTHLEKFTAMLQGAVALSLLAIAAISLATHPNYLSYFNFIAANNPSAYLADSDLDWNQDTKRLAHRLKELGVKEIYFRPFAYGDLEKLYGFPTIHPLDANGPKPGWNVVGLTALRLGFFTEARYEYDPGFQFWPDRMEPTERVGSSYWLFYVPSNTK